MYWKDGLPCPHKERCRFSHQKAKSPLKRSADRYSVKEAAINYLGEITRALSTFKGDRPQPQGLSSLVLQNLFKIFQSVVHRLALQIIIN